MLFWTGSLHYLLSSINMRINPKKTIRRGHEFHAPFDIRLTASGDGTALLRLFKLLDLGRCVAERLEIHDAV